MKRTIFTILAVLLLIPPLVGQTEDSALVRALGAEPDQAVYLSRHPEILRWIGKHPEAAVLVATNAAGPDQKAKNRLINQWLGAWPTLAELLAEHPDQALAWADEPRPLLDLGKKGQK